MQTPLGRLWLLAALCLWPLPTMAQAPAAPIWRCGNNYSQDPCPGGMALEPLPHENAQRRAEADASTVQLRARADAMAAARERRESAAALQGPALIVHPPAPRAGHRAGDDEAAWRGKRPPARTRAPFSARAPAKERARKKD